MEILYVLGGLLVIALLAEYPVATLSVAGVIIILIILISVSEENNEKEAREEFKKTESMERIMDVFCDLAHIQEDIIGSVSFWLESFFGSTEVQSDNLGVFKFHILLSELSAKEGDLEWRMEFISENPYRFNEHYDTKHDNDLLNEVLFDRNYQPKSDCFKNTADYLAKDNGDSGIEDALAIDSFCVIVKEDRRKKYVMLSAILDEIKLRYPNLISKGIRDDVGAVLFGMNPPHDVLNSNDEKAEISNTSSCASTNSSAQ